MEEYFTKISESEKGQIDMALAKVHVRWMIKRDLKEVIDIEAKNFKDPWLLKDFEKQLQERSVIGMVAEVDNKILGYMIYQLHKGKLELLNISVDPLHQGEGIGTTMIEKLKNKLNPNRRNRIELIVGDMNLKTHTFLKNRIFFATSIKKNHFDDRQDGYVFEFFTDLN